MMEVLYLHRFCPFARKRNIAIWSVGLLCLAYCAPLLNFHLEQDECTFGPVSNTEYRSYLAAAKSELPAFMPGATNRDEIESHLTRAFVKLSSSENDIFRRLAVMHAVMRATGAEYRNTNGNNPDKGRSDPFVQAAQGTSTIGFNYLLDLNRLLIFAPWPREAWIIPVLAGPRYSQRPGPSYPKNVGEFGFVVQFPDLITSPFGFDIDLATACPPVPARENAALFAIKQK